MYSIPRLHPLWMLGKIFDLPTVSRQYASD